MNILRSTTYTSNRKAASHLADYRDWFSDFADSEQEVVTFHVSQGTNKPYLNLQHWKVCISKYFKNHANTSQSTVSCVYGNIYIVSVDRVVKISLA